MRLTWSAGGSLSPMGQLDDAIREHLDLKRRRGADPQEVSRQEEEALGPVRREPLPGEDDREAEADEALEAASQPSPMADADAALEGAEPLAGEPPDMPAPPAAPTVVPPDAGPPDAPPATAEWGFDDEEERSGEDEAEPEDEDVLEETPEFLQEAPEHDRLWFEQRPPRDFDFDE
jgi:hypothetical protein